MQKFLKFSNLLNIALNDKLTEKINELFEDH